MAKYTVTATITVEGSAVRSKKRAQNILQIMLNDFDDMNSDLDASVVISIKDIKRAPTEK